LGKIYFAIKLYVMIWKKQLNLTQIDSFLPKIKDCDYKNPNLEAKFWINLVIRFKWIREEVYFVKKTFGQFCTCMSKS